MYTSDISWISARKAAKCHFQSQMIMYFFLTTNYLFNPHQSLLLNHQLPFSVPATYYCLCHQLPFPATLLFSQNNQELLYALLQRQELLTPYRQHPRLGELIENLQVRALTDPDCLHGVNLSSMKLSWSLTGKTVLRWIWGPSLSG